MVNSGLEEAKKYGTLHDFACHPCAGAMLIFSVSFQFYYMSHRSGTTFILFPSLIYWKRHWRKKAVNASENKTCATSIDRLPDTVLWSIDGFNRFVDDDDSSTSGSSSRRLPWEFPLRVNLCPLVVSGGPPVKFDGCASGTEDDGRLIGESRELVSDVRLTGLWKGLTKDIGDGETENDVPDKRWLRPKDEEASLAE